MKKTVFSLAAVAALAMGGSAFAQGLDFASLDADASGTISIEELQVAIPDITPESFALLDSDGDGVLSEQEFAALVPAESAPVETFEEPAADDFTEVPLQ